MLYALDVVICTASSPMKCSSGLCENEHYEGSINNHFAALLAQLTHLGGAIFLSQPGSERSVERPAHEGGGRIRTEIIPCGCDLAYPKTFDIYQ